MSYWNNNGKYQKLADLLGALIPIEGKVVDFKVNKKLEKFRRARNVYYDMFNNGLGNRAREFKPVFGFAASYFETREYMYGTYRKSYRYDMIRPVMDTEMDKIILEAAREQSLI